MISQIYASHQWSSSDLAVLIIILFNHVSFISKHVCLLGPDKLAYNDTFIFVCTVEACYSRIYTYVEVDSVGLECTQIAK